MSGTVATGFAALVGVCVGSFLNVCVFRWPGGDSVREPASRCLGCGTPVRWFENIPLVGYLLLRGRCARCGVRLSVQYPLVEAATGLIWAGMVHRWGMHPEALRGGLFLTILLGISLADVRTYIIPDQFTVGGAGAGLVLAILPGGVSLAEAATGALLGFGLLWGVAALGKILFRRDAMGGGDVKMMAMVGAFLGSGGVLVTLFSGALAGSVIFGPVAYRTGKLVPFGLFLALGAGVAYSWGEEVIRWYMGVVMSLY